MSGSATVATTSGHRLIEQQAAAKEARAISSSNQPEYFINITHDKQAAAPEALGVVNSQEEETSFLDSPWLPMYESACVFCLFALLAGIVVTIWERRSK